MVVHSSGNRFASAKQSLKILQFADYTFRIGETSYSLENGTISYNLDKFVFIFTNIYIPVHKKPTIARVLSRIFEEGGAIPTCVLKINQNVVN